MVRIFVCTSQINALYMILYARHTAQPGHKDVLLLDSVPKRQGLIDLLLSSDKLYPWTRMIDLSIPVAQEGEVAPGLRKKLTRRLRERALVKPVYNFLLKRHLAKRSAAEKRLILDKLSGLGEVTELNLLTQTMANDSLRAMFPHAKVNYFEHGIGDYLFVTQMKPPFDYYCLFADSFRNYLDQKNIPSGFVKAVPGSEQFAQLAREALDKNPDRDKIVSAVSTPGKKVIIFLESMETVHVDDAYWTDYLDLCIAQVPNPKDYLFVLKPHHNQSARALKISADHISQVRGLRTLIVQDSVCFNTSIEVLNQLWNDSSEYAFSTYSSGLFYISRLYANPRVKYCYAYDFFRKYMKRTPRHFARVYEDINGIIKQVCATNAVDISPASDRT
jgi:hypothetical protein